ncbi:MAG: DNA gyrase C-terminal beta-propeller domain-containing protein [Planctomycetota bacterium]
MMIVTASGKIIRLNVDGVSSYGRATQGVSLISTGDDDFVASAKRTAESEAPEEAEAVSDTPAADASATPADTPPEEAPPADEPPEPESA